MDVRRSRGRDHGQALLLVLAAVALAVALAMGLARMAATTANREQAQAAADAAALAGATGGRAAAVRIAEANGATLVAFTVIDRASGTVEVAVSCRGALAKARAARAP
jgi:hypothetical protein